MSYEPYTWKGGDTVTANKLNHIEQGIAQGGSGGILHVPAIADARTITLGMTAGEILSALQEGKLVFASLSSSDDGIPYVFTFLICSGTFDGVYAFQALNSSSSSPNFFTFECENEDDYPIYK